MAKITPVASDPPSDALTSVAPTVTSCLSRSLHWHFDRITGARDAVCLVGEVFQNMALQQPMGGKVFAQ